MRWVKAVGRRLFGRYSLYRVYSLPLGTVCDCECCPARLEVKPVQDWAQLLLSQSPEVRELVGYRAEEAYCLGAWIAGELVAAAVVWYGDTYARRRGFWPLSPGEAKLVQITTDERHRGRGIAPELLKQTARHMRMLGYEKLYARVWHSNRSSIAAFRKAGWVCVAFVVEIHPVGSRRPVRIVWRRRIV